MKICSVVPWFPSIDAENLESRQGIFEYRQAIELHKRGHQFRVISLRWSGQQEQEVINTDFIVYRVPYYFSSMRYPLPRFVKLGKKIREVCDNWSPDLVIYNHMEYLTAVPSLYLRAKINAPVVVTTDGIPGVTGAFGNRIVDLGGYLYALLIGKRIFRLADGIQLMNSELYKYVAKLNIDSHKIFTITRGVDTELFKPHDGDPQLRQELGIEPDDVIILYVGRLDIIKGVDYLMKAIERIASSHQNVKFLIVGEGSLKAKYESLCVPLKGKVIFTGFRKDVPQLMNISHIFVLSSLMEGSPNVILEASSSGLPVVCTAVGEAREFVLDGESGFLVSPRDTEGLTEAIIKLMESPSLRQQMGYVGRKRVEERFSWKLIARRLEEAYQGVIEDHQRMSN